MTQILRALVSLTQLVPATASCWPLTLKSQFLCSRSCRPPSTVNPHAMPCPHWVHPTNQSFQASPSKPFVNQLAKCCDPVPYFSLDYLTLQSIFGLTCQAPWASPVIPQQITCPSNPFFNWHTKHYDPVPSFSSSYLPPQAIFEPTRQDMWASPVIPHQITCHSNPFLNQHAKRCEPVLSFHIRCSAPPSHSWTNTSSAVSQSRHSSSGSSFINDSYWILDMAH